MNYTLASIKRILATIPDISLANLHHNKRTRRSSSGLLPFIGDISKVLFGTATQNEVCNQQVGVDKAIQVGNLNARELNNIGNALKKAMVIHKENMGFDLEAVGQTTGSTHG